MSGGDQKDDAEALNRVHDDQNWRQRIEAEIQATEDWHQFYGFLAADAGAIAHLHRCCGSPR